MLEQARALQDQLIAWRRDFHMHPELSFKEERTAKIIAETLRGMGIRVEEGVGRTGVVGHLGEGHPAVGIRADMDALPIEEATGVLYASQNAGVMHACGHDTHCAMARLLSEMPDRPAGEVRFLFQPSEEAADAEEKSGATRMIEDGALDGLDVVIAQHINSDGPSGVVEISAGASGAAVDSFYADISGEGCHGAYPHKGTDPIFLTAQVMNAIYAIPSRRIDPLQPAVATIGSIHGGSATNVIPDSVTITGTLRSFSDETRERLLEELERALSTARTLGGDYKLTIERGYPVLINEPGVTALIRAAAADLLGAEGVAEHEPVMGAEDFAYMVREAPGAMFSLGAKLDTVNRPHHSPIFNIDESALPVGVAVLAESTVRLLKGKAVSG
jgi:amidohydrolase